MIFFVLSLLSFQRKTSISKLFYMRCYSIVYVCPLLHEYRLFAFVWLVYLNKESTNKFALFAQIIVGR